MKKVTLRLFNTQRVLYYFVKVDGIEAGRIGIAFGKDDAGKGYYNAHRYCKGDKNESIIDVALTGNEPVLQSIIDKVKELHPHNELNDALNMYCHNAVHVMTKCKSLSI